jgi:hypothetical protein
MDVSEKMAVAVFLTGERRRLVRKFLGPQPSLSCTLFAKDLLGVRREFWTLLATSFTRRSFSLHLEKWGGKQ